MIALTSPPLTRRAGARAAAQKAQLRISPDYGYGARGFPPPPVIPANSELIFDVQVPLPAPPGRAGAGAAGCDGARSRRAEQPYHRIIITYRCKDSLSRHDRADLAPPPWQLLGIGNLKA